MSLIWIIDDEPSICTALSRALNRIGHETRIFSEVESPLRFIRTRKSPAQPFVQMPDLILLDVRLPGTDGLTASSDIQKLLANVPIIIMTAFGDLKTAVRAIEGRVFEYLTKPFDLDEMLSTVRRAIDSQRVNETLSNASITYESEQPNSLVGTSTAMQSVFKKIALAAASDCPVLLTGESGTGKELVARAIHMHSAHCNQPYLAISLVSIASQFDSELFGYDSGGQLRSDGKKGGLLELAGKGSILLDEIGELSLSQQVKILRVLEQKEFVPVGSTTPRPLECRVLATTNRNLQAMVSDGSFREDLYFRLAVFTIDLPPLRQRPEDIIPLAKQFLVRYGYSIESDSLSDSTIMRLNRHSWNGNVRELRNAIEHASILARGQRIYPEHLPELRASRSTEAISNNENDIPSDIPSQLDRLIRLWLKDQNTNLGMTSDESSMTSASNPQPEDLGTIYDSFLGVVEPSLIRALLETAQGNRASVANALGLHRSTLRQKMRRHKMDNS